MKPAENAGKPWTSDDEARLLKAFEAEPNIAQLARQFGRTPQAIQGRLYRLGKVPRWQLSPQWNGRAVGDGLAAPSPRDRALVTAEEPFSLERLNAAARALLDANFSPRELPNLLQTEITNLQLATQREIVFGDEGDGSWFRWKARPTDGYVSVRKSNEVRFLAGKVDGVWLVVNLHKPGEYRHENAHVAEVLRAVANAIERAEVPLADHDMRLRVGDSIEGTRPTSRKPQRH